MRRISVDLVVLHAVDHEVHHRRLEQQPALDDLGEGRDRLVAAPLGLVHADEDVVGRPR